MPGFGRTVAGFALCVVVMTACNDALDIPSARVDFGGAVDLAAPTDASGMPPRDLASASVDLAAGADLSLRDLFYPTSDLYGPALDMATPCASPLMLCDGICTDPSHTCGACSTPCALGDSCLADGDCKSDACDALTLTCVADRCDDHRRDGNESDIDCGDGICPGCATAKSCNDDASCQSLGCDFFKHTCVFSCADHQLDNAETDVDCGGADSCDGCGQGKKCLESFDCTGGHECLGGTCTFAACIDGTLDGFETDLDCGGLCTGCALGKHCKVDGDCGSALCDPSSLKCVATECDDAKKDGNETDVDCGGACPRCGANHACLVDSDCVSQACDGVSYRCVGTSCGDRRIDGSETDVDCGGTSCGPCALYQRCALDGDCTSNTCDAGAQRCVPPSCADHVLGGNETDIDCGGECATCTLGGACLVDQDCTSTACDGVSFVCVADECSDHQLDNSESDIDCGGLTCPSCAFGQTCTYNNDCASDACSPSNLCQLPFCMDGVLDGIETAVDCGGSICPPCPLGDLCYLDSDCISAACDPTLLMCISDQCNDHRQDGAETDVDCGGTHCATRCAVGRKCDSSSDCLPGHACSLGIPELCM